MPDEAFALAQIIAFLFLCLLCGVQVLRVLGVRSLGLLLSAGLGLGIATHLTLLNAFLRIGLSLDFGHALSLGLGLGLAAGLSLASSPFWMRRFPARAAALAKIRMETPRWEALLLVVCAFITWFSTNASQFGLADQDFWIHTPLQRFLLDGQFPPLNPYFPELELHGHYGRDLLIVSTSWLSGWDVFRSQMMVTSFCQSLALPVVYLAVRQLSGSRLQATLATLFLYLGTNTVYRAGWLDEFVSHSPLSHLHWSLMLLGFGLWWRSQSWRTAIFLGLLVGSHGLVFTTTFGTAVVAIALTVLTLKRHRTTLLQTGLALMLAGGVAAFQGGAISNFAKDAVNLEDQKNQAQQNQSQAVVVKFPKAPLFGIAKHVSDKSHSDIYKHFPATIFFQIFDGEGLRYTERYTPIWSWEFLRLHWLAVFLAPLSLVELLRRRNGAGLFCWHFGLVSYLTPGLFDFGPVHENDWFRWVIWTGSGFAAALGIALGSWFETATGWTKKVAWVFAPLVIWLNTLTGFYYLLVNIPENVKMQGGLMRVATVDITTEEWLRAYGPYLEVQPVDVEAFRWLNAQQVAGQKVLVNFDARRPWGVQFESALSGYTGLHPLGHQLPLNSDRIGLPPARMTPLAHSVLHYPSLRALEALGPDWIYLRLQDPSFADKLLALPGVEVGFRKQGHDGLTRLVLRVKTETGS